MNNLLMFLECDLGDQNTTTTLLNVLYYIKLVLKILQIVIPIGLILMGTIDMGKAVIAGDEKKMKEAQKPFVKRIISAVIVFCIPFIVTVVVNLVTDDTVYKDCWSEAAKPQTKFGNALDTNIGSQNNTNQTNTNKTNNKK